MTFDHVAVVGAGLIGGSVARRLAVLGRGITVVEPDVAGREWADIPHADSIPSDADLVVVAVPLDAMPTVLTTVAEQAPGAVVIDVGSVKGAVADAAHAAGLADRYVGAHPMAGTEQSGFAHSTPDLLVGATWAVTRGSGPVADVVAWVAETFDATVLVTDAEAHDRAVALVSHAPHVVANALLGVVAQADDPAARHLAAGSFRDGTRVAGRDARRTRNMLADNAAALGPVVDELIAALEGYRADLADPDALLARLDRVAPWRRGEPAWAPADLAAAVAAGTPTLVRRTVSGWESAPAG